MQPRRSPRQIITWTVILTTMAATLTVLWNMVIVGDYFRFRELAQRAATEPETGFRWFVFSLGVIFLIAICVGLLMMGVKLLREVDFSQKQSNFIAGVTHEFKSPLAGIRLGAETLLNREMSDADRRRFLEGMLDEVDRLNRLVNNVLAAGKIDLHRLELLRTPRDLNSFLAEYHAARSRAMHNHKVQWQLDVHGRAPIVMDATAMHMVLDNLVENALKYSEGPKSITLGGSVEDGEAVIRVTDNGIGLTQADAPEVFERFYRGVHQPSKRVPGTGLGLFLVQRMVKAHGGTVRMVSEGPGKGATAEVRIPLTRVQGAMAEVAA